MATRKITTKTDRLERAINNYLKSIKALKKEIDICNWHDTEGIHCNSANLVPYIINYEAEAEATVFDSKDSYKSWVRIATVVGGKELFCLLGIEDCLVNGFFESEHDYYAFMGGFDDDREGC